MLRHLAIVVYQRKFGRIKCTAASSWVLGFFPNNPLLPTSNLDSEWHLLSFPEMVVEQELVWPVRVAAVTKRLLARKQKEEQCGAVR